MRIRSSLVLADVVAVVRAFFVTLAFILTLPLAVASCAVADEDAPPRPVVPASPVTGGDVPPAAFSADGRFFLTAATGTGEDSITVWNVETGRAVRRFADREVSAQAIAPDGSRVLLGRGDGSASLLDPASGREIHRLDGHEERIEAAAFTPDGTRVVTGGRDRTMRVWEVATGREVHRCDHDGWITSVRLSPDGACAVTRSDLGTARSWNVESGLEASFVREPRQVTAIAISGDGRFVATAVAIGFRNVGPRGSPPSERRYTGPWNVHVHEVATGKRLIRCAAQREHVIALAFARDSKSVLTGGRGGIARELTVASGLEARRFDLGAGGAAQGTGGGTDAVDVVSVAFGRDGVPTFVLRHRPGPRYVFVAAAAIDGAVRRTEELPEWPVLSPDGGFVLAGGGEGLPSMIDVKTGERRPLGRRRAPDR